MDMYTKGRFRIHIARDVYAKGRFCIHVLVKVIVLTTDCTDFHGSGAESAASPEGAVSFRMSQRSRGTSDKKRRMRNK